MFFISGKGESKVSGYVLRVFLGIYVSVVSARLQ